VPLPAPVAPGPGTQLADLQSLSCGRVNVEVRGGQSVLSGYVAADDDLKQVKLVAANVPNTSLGDVIVTPWPQCEALQTLEKPLQISDRPTIDIGPTTELRNGDLLQIRIGSPAQISYLYVSYTRPMDRSFTSCSPTASCRSRRFRDKRWCSAAARTASRNSPSVRPSAAR